MQTQLILFLNLRLNSVCWHRKWDWYLLWELVFLRLAKLFVPIIILLDTARILGIKLEVVMEVQEDRLDLWLLSVLPLVLVAILRTVWEGLLILQDWWLWSHITDILIWVQLGQVVTLVVCFFATKWVFFRGVLKMWQCGIISCMIRVTTRKFQGNWRIRIWGWIRSDFQFLHRKRDIR